MMGDVLGRTKIVAVLDVLGLKGSLCIDIDVSSPVHNTACIHISREVTQWARQSSECTPNIEGMDAVLMNGGAAVATPGPKTRICASGNDCVYSQTTPPPPTSRPIGTQASQESGTDCFPVTISALERHVETA